MTDTMNSKVQDRIQEKYVSKLFSLFNLYPTSGGLAENFPDYANP